MKKILIVNNNMHIGGVQKALANLLWAVRERYEITLLLFYPGGKLMDEIPPEVKVISPKTGYRYLGMTKYDVHSRKDKVGRTFYGAITRLFGRKYAVRLMAMRQQKLSGFDVAVSYLHNSVDKMFYGGCNDFVLNHVAASRKVTFLHCDYERCGAQTTENAKQYACFDAVAACSQGCADAFLRANPGLRDRIKVVPNCHRFEKIRADAEELVSLSEGVMNVVTVARLGKEKGVERALRAIAMLKEEKKLLHYYVVGDGVQRETLLRIMEEENLSDTVTMCGMLENPYGYIHSADLLLIPSYNEAAPLVIGEAACLGVPVLSTKTSSAYETIEKMGYGWVCENSEEGIAKGLRTLLDDPAGYRKIKDALQQIKLDNLQALAGFAATMEDNDDIKDKSM